MISPAAPPTKIEDRINFFILLLVAPSVLGFICSILSQTNPGGAWWLFAGFGNLAAFFGIAVAALTALLSTALWRMSLAFLGFAFVEIAFAAVLLWSAAHLVKNPWV